MAKLKGIVLAGLAAGAASFLSKKENRDKAMEFFDQAMEKVNEKGGIQGLMAKVLNGCTNAEAPVEETLQEVATTAASDVDEIINGNEMLNEGGGQATIDEFNSDQDSKS